MYNKGHPYTFFVVVSLLIAAGALCVMGLIFGSWVPYVCAALTAGGAIGLGMRQPWGAWLALAAGALGVGALVHYRAERMGLPRAVAPAVSLAAMVAGLFAWNARQRQARKGRILAARKGGDATAQALASLADGAPPPGAPDQAEASPGEQAPGAKFRSLVLLTRGQPTLDPAKIKQRLGKWLGVRFSDSQDESDNFLVGHDNLFMAKLKSTNIYMITLLHRPYWDSEDVRPYQLLARMNEQPELADDLTKTDGAILIDAHMGEMPEIILGLAKVAAACLSANTGILLSPAALKAHKVSAELARTLVQAKEPADLVGPLCSFVPVWGDGRIRCMTRGLSLLDLPDVLTVVEDTEEHFERARAAVQSVAMYQARRGKPVEVRDTCTVPDVGSYRVSREPGAEAPDVICLVPIEAPPPKE